MMPFRPPGSATALALLVMLAPARLPASDRAPEWLRAAAAQPIRDYGSRVDAVVLLRDRTVHVRSNGRLEIVERGAVRVLTNEGRASAHCSAVYLTDGGRVSDMRGWLLTPGGHWKSLDRKDCIDTRLASEDVYDEARARILSAADHAQAGAVFGYEWSLEQRTIFHQLEWMFQDHRPTHLSRLTVGLPDGWSAQGFTLNHEPIPPETTSAGLRWELRDLAPIDIEPWAPPLSARAPRIAVSVLPDARDARAKETAFRSWAEVSAWLVSLAAGETPVGGQVMAQASALASGQPTGLARIRAIGVFVQGLNYVSVQTGIGRGGGYRPHAAAEVLQKGYGDCKDKANLMRVLLAALDVPAWMVAVYAGDPDYVRDEWPSPQQFNHAIVAVHAQGGDSLAAAMQHPVLGPLVLFDPTDPLTPFGELPETLQRGLALVVRDGEQGLIRLPGTSPVQNALRRTVDVRMHETGAASAVIQESSTGSMARGERALRHRLGTVEYRRVIEAWVARGVPGAEILSIRHSENEANRRFELNVEVKADRYGRAVTPDLLAVCPAWVSRREWLEFTDPVRTRSIALMPEYTEEAVTIDLPPSLRVEELPEAMTIETDFASYRTRYALEDRQVRFHRILEIHGTTLPPERYEEVQMFFKAVRRGETALVLLASGP